MIESTINVCDILVKNSTYTKDTIKHEFLKDPLKVLITMRFAIQFNFKIDKVIADVMHDTEVLNQLSNYKFKEKITSELRKMLISNKSIFDTFIEFSDVIATIIPEIAFCINAPHNSPWHKHDIYEHSLYVVDNCNTTKFEIKLAALLHDIGKPNCRTHDIKNNCDHFRGHSKESERLAKYILNHELKLSSKEQELILNLIKEHDKRINPQIESIRKFIIEYDLNFVRDWLILKEADIKDHTYNPKNKLKWEDLLNRLRYFKENFKVIEKLSI